MAQRDPLDPALLSTNRPLAADFELNSHTREGSMLYAMLPSVVKSRLPHLSSLRRSVSMYGLATRRKSADSRLTSGSRTPEAGYTSAMVLSGSRAMVSEEDMTGYFAESVATSSDEDISPSPTPKGRRSQRMDLTESKSGIVWKFANQGLSLLSLAVEESSTISQDPSFGNASFARQLYLHALAYLLRALPEDLTTEEQLSIRSSLPNGVVDPLRLESSSAFTTQSHRIESDQRSLLHRTLASTIIQFFILFQFILPYLKHLLSAAYQYDREHKISEKILRQGIETVDGLGKTGLGMTATIYGMGDGRVGQLITEIVAWIIEGVTGGIHEGVGEGMVILGAVPRKSQGVSERR